MKVENDYNNKPAISIEFNLVATGKLARITEENLGKPIAIIINDRVITAPIINSPVSSGTLQISLGYSKKETEYFVSRISAASIPATRTIVKEELNKEQEPFLKGNPVFYLVIFLIVSAISYLIFKLPGRNNSNPVCRIDFGNNPTP